MIKLMIADDEAGIRKGLRHYVDWSTWDIQLVAEAKNGDEAFSLAIQTQPDILLSDIRMPGRDGIQLARDLREILPSLRVILLTGYSDTQYLQSALKIGVKDYLLKPAGVENIVESVLGVQKEVLKERSRYLEDMSKDALLNEGIPTLQMHFMNDLICGRLSKKETILSKAQRLQLPLAASCLQLGLLRAGDSDAIQHRPSQEHDMDLWHLTRTMNTVAENYPGSFFVELEPELFLLLHGADSRESVHQSIGTFCQELCELLPQKLYPALAIGIGIPVEDVRELSLSYQSAKRALGLWAWDTSNRIFSYTAFPQAREDLEKAHKYENASSLAYMQGQRQEGIACFESMFAAYAHAKADLEEVKRSCRRLLLLAAQWDLQEQGAEKSEQLTADIEHMEAFMDASELRRFMLSYLSCGGQKESSCSSPLVRKAQDFIRTHYAEDITLQSIAKEIFVTPNYLGRIFREQTGYKLGDWLNKYRVTQAKRLLDDPDLKTYEVASKVGFNSYKYFSVCFLKHAGCSARDYRSRRTS